MVTQDDMAITEAKLKVLTETERRVLGYLVEAYNTYKLLPVENITERVIFDGNLHNCLMVMRWRAERRLEKDHG